MMSRIAFILLAITVALTSLAGCAVTKGSDSQLEPASSLGREDSAERARARAHTELASGYFEIGNLAVALEEAREAVRSDANYGPAHNIAALVYTELKEDRLAEESYQRALRINPLDSDANNNYGSFLCQRKREEEAIRYFLAAVRNPLYQAPDRSYVNAGVCARRRGDTAGAQGYFLLALKTRPAQPQALYQMADLSYARGSYEEAKDYLGRLTQSAQATPEALWLGVRIERKLGDRNIEESYATQLRRNFPNSREARALLSGQQE